jgi:ankyrin repeat protein
MDLFSSLDFFTHCCSPTNGKMVMAESTGISDKRVRPTRQSTKCTSNSSATHFSRHSSHFSNTSINCNDFSSPSSSNQEAKPSIDLRQSSATVPEQTRLVTAESFSPRNNSWYADFQEHGNFGKEDDPEVSFGLNDLDPSAPTALHKACRRGNLKIVQHLLKVIQHQNLDSVDHNGDTALHICAQSGNYRACEILCEVILAFFQSTFDCNSCCCDLSQTEK